MCPHHHEKRPRLFRALRPLVLASKSPRREELLAKLGLSFEIHPAGIEEPPPSGEPPAAYTLSLARLKAKAVASHFPEKAILAADTVVVCEGKILGKPRHRAEAQEMLRLLSGNHHEVITAYVILFQGEERARAVRTEVFFKELAPEEIEAYLETGEPFDKAGAYAIQGIASYMVREVKGSVTGVIGLPLAEVIEDLLNLGIITFAGGPDEGQR